MKQQNYKYLLYLIVITIVITIATQLYWNIQNYNTNKQRLINEVQISLDNGVEAYYSDLAKTDIFTFISDSTDRLDLTGKNIARWNHSNSDSTFIEIEKNLDSVQVYGDGKGFTQILDSSKGITAIKSGKVSSVSVFQGENAVDSVQGLEGLTNRIIVSLFRGSMNFKKLDTLFKKELERKDIAISYEFKHLDHNKVLGRFNESNEDDFELNTFSKSTYLPANQKIQIGYSNPTLAALDRSLTGILLSFLLTACTISCLIYLLHVINKQKELAEIKNDLISNITHEFKTPIATVSTAIEGIKNFNENNDMAKTAAYLDISEQQIKKLNIMVEKLLETATLDSDKLIIKKEEIDLVSMLKGLIAKYKMLATNKEIVFKTNQNSVAVSIDPFHFENAVANIIDNAAKYGGDTINVQLNATNELIEITVADNGKRIDKNQREKIFDKFYRIPTGNRHDVKGFGIGLFYTKKIIEKHEGTLALLADTKKTTFKIIL